MLSAALSEIFAAPYTPPTPAPHCHPRLSSRDARLSNVRLTRRQWRGVPFSDWIHLALPLRNDVLKDASDGRRGKCFAQGFNLEVKERAGESDAAGAACFETSSRAVAWRWRWDK